MVDGHRRLGNRGIARGQPQHVRVPQRVVQHLLVHPWKGQRCSPRAIGPASGVPFGDGREGPFQCELDAGTVAELLAATSIRAEGKPTVAVSAGARDLEATEESWNRYHGRGRKGNREVGFLGDEPCTIPGVRE